MKEQKNGTMKKMKNFCDISTCWNPGKLSCPSGQLSCWRVSSSSFSLSEFPAAHPGSSYPTFQQVEMSQNSSFFSLLHFSFLSFFILQFFPHVGSQNKSIFPFFCSFILLFFQLSVFLPCFSPQECLPFSIYI